MHNQQSKKMVEYMHVSIYKSNTYKGKKFLKRMKRKPLSHVQNN